MMHAMASLVLALSVFARPTLAVRVPNASFDLLSYNDVYDMEPDNVAGIRLGGPSRVVPLAKAMRAANPNSLVLFAGDTVSPSLWSAHFRGLQMIEAHNAIGLDFASLGNHEFDFGLENFVNVTQASTFQWLNANCYERASRTLVRGTVPHAIKTLSDAVAGTISIGLFGVMYDMGNSSEELYWEDPLAAARDQVTALQALHVDFIIALTHQNAADDNRFSKEVTGIDLIIGGHDHKLMVQTSFGTPYLKAEYNFRSIWKSHVEYYGPDGTNGRKALMQHQAISISEDLPSDKKLDAVIASYQAQLTELEKQVIGTVCAPLDLTQNVVRTTDCKIGHVFADASRAYYGTGVADVAVMNGGGIRGDKIVAAGNLTIGDVLAWSPFGNTLVTARTNGASLRLFLTHELMANCGQQVIVQNGYYVHPSGFNYTFTCTETGVGTVSRLEWLDHPTFAGAMQDSDEFVLALSDFEYTSRYILVEGVNATLEITEAEAERVDTALEAYVAKQPNGVVCPPDEVRSIVTF